MYFEIRSLIFSGLWRKKCRKLEGRTHWCVKQRKIKTLEWKPWGKIMVICVGEEKCSSFLLDSLADLIIKLPQDRVIGTNNFNFMCRSSRENMTLQSTQAMEAYTPPWTKEKGVGAGGFKGEEVNSQQHEKKQIFSVNNCLLCHAHKSFGIKFTTGNSSLPGRGPLSTFFRQLRKSLKVFSKLAVFSLSSTQNNERTKVAHFGMAYSAPPHLDQAMR